MKISIHRALAQLKTTRARNEKEIDTADFISTTVGNSGKAGAMTVGEKSADITSSYERIQTLLRNFEQLRMAITRSNSGIDEATTNISYADPAKKMTVAEIVAYQTHIIPLKQELLQHMAAEYNTVAGCVEDQNARISEKGMQTFTATFGGKENAKNVSSDELESFMNTYKKNNAMKLVDPLGLKDKIEKMRTDLDEDIIWADAALSEANALRTIDIDM